MNLTKLPPFLACLVASALVAKFAIADSIISEFRHLTKPDSLTSTPPDSYYGCDVCVLDFFDLSIFPATPSFEGATPPNANYTSLANISQGPFEFGGQAGMTVTILEPPASSDSYWFTSEMHVQTAVDFLDTVQVMGVTGGQEGFIEFNWILTGDHFMEVNPTNSIGPQTVKAIELATSATLLMDVVAMDAPPGDNPPFISSETFLGANGSPVGVDIDTFETDDVAVSADVEFINVPYTQGTAVAVSFDLLLTADYHMGTADATSMTGKLDADFSSTATLKSADVYGVDEFGTSFLIEGAYLQSTIDGKIYPSSSSPGPITINIDVKPDDETNAFNNNGNGVIPVAILGSDTFDVTQIDLDTVELDTLQIKVAGKSNNTLAHLEDVNEDSFIDYVVQIEDSDVVYEEGDDLAMLTGMLFDGQEFMGTDSIWIVPPNVPEPTGLSLVWLVFGMFAVRRYRPTRRPNAH